MKGDVFEGVSVELLQRLDDYEGSDYSRQLANVTMEDGRILAAYLYCYVLPTDQLDWLPTGDWNNLV